MWSHSIVLHGRPATFGHVLPADFNRAFKSCGAASFQDPEIVEGLPLVVVHCIFSCTENSMKSRGLASASNWLAGVEGTAPRGCEGAVQP